MTEKKILVEPKDGIVTIYEGKALELKHPEKVVIKGDFNAVKNFIAKRLSNDCGLQAIDIHKSVIEVDIVDGTIKLDTNPNDVFGTVVNAIIEFHPNLLVFGINTSKVYTQQDFVKLLKINRRFMNPDKYDGILSAYASFIIKAANESKQEVANQRGSSNNAFNKDVDTGILPLEFTLVIPIFKGGLSEKFNVQVYVDVVEKSIKFSLESIDLIELIERRKEELFSHQIENDFEGILVINK